MKKTNTKTTSPAPATSAAKPSRKKAAAQASATTTAVATAPVAATPVATPRVAVPATAKPVAIPAPAAPAPVKAVAAASVQTKIIVRADVGFGNALYIRGDGAGLTWNQGVPMECVASDQWELTLGESARPISFKVLVNDATWCTGPDSVVASGSTVTVVPEFA